MSEEAVRADHTSDLLFFDSNTSDQRQLDNYSPLQIAASAPEHLHCIENHQAK